MAIITMAIILSWHLLYRGYYYTVAIITPWLLLRRGYYSCGHYALAIITLAIMAWKAPV